MYRNDACVVGGESVVVDGFAVLEKLRREYPQHFSTLARVPATFQKIHYERYTVHHIIHTQLCKALVFPQSQSSPYGV